jgi:hypothetical protein
MSTQIGIPAMSNNRPDWMGSLTTPKKDPVMATFVAEGGMGKTTLASLWPSPIFIPIEDGSAALVGRDDIAMFPTPPSVTVAWVMECLEKLAAGGHPFKTVVLDSITQLSTIIEGEIIEADPKKPKSINQALGGYGAGYSAMSDVHEKVRKLCGQLKSKGMHVVFLAHANAERVNLPDQPEYMRYSIRMHKDSVSHYSDNVDLVAFIKLKTFVSDERRATTSGQRIITCYPIPSHISKNRYGITKDLDFVEGVNPFAAIL